MARTCTRCGVESELDDVFEMRRHSFGRRHTFLCPQCVAATHARDLRAVAVMILVLGLIGISWAWAAGEWWAANFALALLFSVAIVPIHECVHALIARLLGLRLFRMIIGAGRLLFTIRPGVPIEVRAVPFGGLLIYGHVSRRFLRLRTFLVALAGPLSNVAMLWFALAYVAPGEIVQCYDNQLMPIGAFAVANAIVLFANLLPLRARTSLGSVPRDGLAMLLAPFMSGQQVDVALTMRYALESATASEARDYVEVRRWSEEGLAVSPDAAILRYNVALAHFYLDDFTEARRAFLKVLELPDLDPLLRASTESSVAASDVRLDAPELLGEADRLSEKAFGSIPWSPTVRGARGSVLVEMGLLDEGLSLLRQAMELSEDAEVSAIFACWIAIGEGRRGDQDEALRYLARARELDASCSALPRAEREVEAAYSGAKRNPPLVI